MMVRIMKSRRRIRRVMRTRRIMKRRSRRRIRRMMRTKSRGRGGEGG